MVVADELTEADENDRVCDPAGGSIEGGLVTRGRAQTSLNEGTRGHVQMQKHNSNLKRRKGAADVKV